MTQRKAQTTRVRNLVAFLLVIVVLFGAYFFFYTDSREDLVTEHHLRLLSSAGRYSSDALEGVLGSVRLALSVSERDIAPTDKISEKQKIERAINTKLEQIKAL